MADQAIQNHNSSQSFEKPKAYFDVLMRKIQKGEDMHACGSSKERIQFYNDHVHDFDLVNQHSGYTGPVHTARALHKYLNGDVTKSILDVGAGSGYVAAKLRACGDYRNIDGLDPAAGLLQIGLETGLYRNIFNQYFYNDCGLEENGYDGLTCSGCFVPGHLKSECLREMCRVVKPGGYVVIVTGLSYFEEDEDLQLFRPTMEEMVKEGKWVVMEDYKVNDYAFGDTPGQVFVFKKL